MPEKIIRDPVHDVIALDLGDAADRLILDLLACREVQRLRRVRQLGLASLAYPGADHSRYSHSLGVFHTARLILGRLAREGHRPAPKVREATLVAALLHDLGHGPFSHVFERVSGIDHEGITRRLILDPDSEVHRVLIRRETTLPERAVALLTGEAGDEVARDVLASQLDADRLDYLLRDNLHTGSRYGRYDLAWLLQAMTVADNRLAINGKGVSAAEAYLQARYHMYRHVYFHKVVRAAEGMVKLALQRARELILSGDPPGDVGGAALAVPPGGGPVTKVLTGDRLTAGEFHDLDDVSVLACFKSWRSGGDAALADLCAALLDRRLYKTIDLSHLDATAAEAAARSAATAVGNSGGDPTYHVFYDAPANLPYSRDNGVRVADRSATRDLADASGFVAALAAADPGARRLHVHPDHRDAAAGVLD